MHLLDWFTHLSRVTQEYSTGQHFDTTGDYCPQSHSRK